MGRPIFRPFRWMVSAVFGLFVLAYIYQSREIIPGNEVLCIEPGCSQAVALAGTSAVLEAVQRLNITEVYDLRKKYLSHLHFTAEEILSTDGVSALNYQTSFITLWTQ